MFPASNGFNSYFDKDEGSIGGLKNPPPVDKGLYNLANLLDVIALVLAYIFVNEKFMIMLVVYMAFSRAYSHTSIRLKKYAFLSWFLAGFFQGAFVWGAIYLGLNDFSFGSLLRPHVWQPALLSSVMLLGSYPMTQIYQHEEDRRRGDITLSALLGIRGTFYFTAIFFTVASVLFFIYYQSKYGAGYEYIFIMAMIPVVGYFIWWLMSVLKSPLKANYQNTMHLNFISATCLGGFFLYVFLHSTNILSVAGQY